MCTLSVFQPERGPGVAGADGLVLRVMVNRDEQRSRAASLPPEVRRTGVRLSVFPVDPVGGGTWIGVNDAGVVAALLNVTAERLGGERMAVRPGLVSRGGVVPMVLAEGSVDAAVASAVRWDPRQTRPFRLWISDGRVQRVVVSDGRVVYAPEVCALASPVMLASSGLGDELVRLPREGAFSGLIAAHGWSMEVQDRFHELTDAANGALGVLMCRADARTVSRTEVVLHAGKVEMRHTLLGDDLRPSGREHMVRLELNRAGARIGAML